MIKEIPVRPLTDLERYVLNNYSLNAAGEIVSPTGRVVYGRSCSSRYLQLQLYFEGRPRNFMVHRAVFLLTHGYLPVMIDHIDRDPTNNNINNLRPTNPSLNATNCRKKKGRCSSNYKGVIKRPNGRFQVIFRDKVLGTFADEIVAAKKYNEHASVVYGQHAILNEV